MGNAHPNIVPYQDFPTRDGYMVIAVGNDAQFSRLCQAAGQPGIAIDPRYRTNKDRVQNRKELISQMNAFTVTRSTQEWIMDLETVGVPCGPINNLEQVFADPHVKARQIHQKLEHPSMGTVSSVASPIRLSETPVQYRMAPPLLGEHTHEVLCNLLGMSEQEVSALQQAGVV